MANSVGKAAKRSSRRCFTCVKVIAPTVPRTALPTKLTVAEKHMEILPKGLKPCVAIAEQRESFGLGSGLADAPGECIFVGPDANQFVDFLFRLQFHGVLSTDDGLIVSLRIGDGNVVED